jgi:hypothetical protein
MFIQLQLFSNPLPPPINSLKISEFMFNSDNTWTLELADDFLGDNVIGPCDSLFICSSTGRAKVKDIQAYNLCSPPYGYYSSPYIVITPDDLHSSLHINKEGDSVTIVHFHAGREDFIPKPVLTFGNYPNAMIGKPAEGQSIVAVINYSNYGALYNYSYYSKNNNPSFGDCDKDVNYMSGNIRGKIYDENGQPLRNRTFMFYPGYGSKTDNEGNYNLKVYSNTLILDTIRLKEFESDKKYNMYGVVYFVQMDIEVGDVIDLDIQIMGKLVSSPEVKTSTNPIKLYPNPVERGSVLNYEIDLPVFTANVELEVRSLTGQLLLRKKITDNTGVIDLQREVPGIYILNCVMNGKNIYSTRIIIAK